MAATRLTGIAAVACSVLLAGCSPEPGAPDAALAAECFAASDPIAAIQGRDFTSPALGQARTVQGVITHITDQGLYLESLSPDQDPGTSEGLFLQLDSVDGKLAPGQVIRAQGTVAELGERRDTITALSPASLLATCGTQASLPRARIELPMRQAPREQYEGMRVSLANRSFVTDVYRLRDGVLRIAADGPLPAPTEVAWPGEDARRQQADNRDNSLYVQLAPGDLQAFGVGTELLSDLGVLGHDGRGPSLLLEGPANLNIPAPPPLGGPQSTDLRVVSLNLHNYFNGDGKGGGFPTSRGAETPAQWAAQRERLRAALHYLQPDIVAVMELENDGFDSRSAAADFAADLGQATGVDWRVASPGTPRIGSDEITVGLFYRPSRVRASGRAEVLDAAPFDLLNRVPLSQLFEHPGSGTRFLVNVNHFKSKGGCPEQGRDRDQGDGQACWNAARLKAARALAPWVLQQAEAQAQGRLLVLGDLNAYRMEDPLRALLDAGLVDLTGAAGGPHQFSYVFAGQSGTLDHALASPALARLVFRAQIININSPYPPGMDLQPAWLRSSDHDPVVVDLRFTHSATSR